MTPLPFDTLSSDQAQPNVYRPLWGKKYMKHAHTHLDIDTHKGHFMLTC